MVAERHIYMHAVVKPHKLSHDIELHVNKQVCHIENTIMKVEAAVF